jgi:hypothetical protein
LEEGRVHPAAVQTELDVAPHEALLAAEHLYRRSRRQDHDGGKKDVRTRTQVHACREGCHHLGDAGGRPRHNQEHQRCAAHANDPRRRLRHGVTCIIMCITCIASSRRESNRYSTAQPELWIAAYTEEE